MHVRTSTGRRDDAPIYRTLSDFPNDIPRKSQVAAREYTYCYGRDAASLQVRRSRDVTTKGGHIYSGTVVFLRVWDRIPVDRQLKSRETR